MNRSHRLIGRVAGAVLAAVSLCALAVPAAHAAAVTPPLGSAAGFAAVAATTITNTGQTVVTGDIGVSPGTAITGFPPGIVNGTIHANDGPAASATADVLTAYNQAAGEPCEHTLANPDLGGQTLIPGVYCITGTGAGLTGTLTLDAQGDANAAWLFQIESTLTTASNSAVVLINGASPCSNGNITWQVGSSATLGSSTSFVGNILAHTSVTLNTGASSTGGLYAHTGAVTMDTNVVGTCASGGGGGPGGLANPTISTTPSGSVPVGGSISDTARVIGGAAPTGSVRFDLYAPGDVNCMTVLATRTGALSGGNAASGPVTATAPGTYRWVARYSGDPANNPIVSPCGSELVVVTSQILTGRAYGLSANATLLGGSLINITPRPDTGHVSTTASSSTSTPCIASIAGSISAKVLCAKVVTSAPLGRSTASASVNETGVGISSIPTVKLGVVQSTSTTTCAGSSGTTTIAYLKVGNTVVISQPTSIAPNTQVTVGVVKLVLNEQIPFSTPDDGLTVNAVHVRVNAVNVAKLNLVVASSESDVGNCP
jgi:hypothetical protein